MSTANEPEIERAAPKPFRRFSSSPEVIRPATLLYMWVSLPLRNMEDLLCGVGFDICHKTVRLWRNGFGSRPAGYSRR